MATLKLFRSGHQDSEIPLDPAKGYSVGSSPGSRVVLEENGVSRNHCRFSFADGSWWVEDIGSTDGTFVKGVRIQKPVALAHSDEVRVGDVMITLDAYGAGEGQVALSLEEKDENSPGFVEERDPHGFPVYSNQGPQRAPPPREKILVLVREGPRPQAVPLDKELTLIGSGAHCDIRLDGWFIRSEQAAVLKDKTGLRILNQGGLHPLRVNGEKVEEAYVVPGDEIILAGHRFSLKSL